MPPRSAVPAIIAVFAILLCTGCNANHRAGRPDRAVDPKLLIDKLRSTESTRLENLVDSYYATNNPVVQKQVRNKIVDVSTILIDQQHSIFLSKFSAGRKDFDTAMDIGSMATDAVSVIVTPAMTKSILSAISGGLTATKVTVDKNYFYGEAIKVIIKQMEAQRRTASAALIAGVNREVQEYSLSAALQDLERYYFAGTIDGAFAGIVDNASKQINDADKSILKSIADQRGRQPLISEILKTPQGRANLAGALEQWISAADERAKGKVLSAVLALLFERQSEPGAADQVSAFSTAFGTNPGTAVKNFMLAQSTSDSEIIRLVANATEYGFDLRFTASN